MGDYRGFIIKRAAYNLCVTKHLAAVLRVDYRGCKVETENWETVAEGQARDGGSLEWQGIGCREGLRYGKYSGDKYSRECAGGLNINSPRLGLSG